MFRIGFGYDVHALVEARKLILGGVEITHSKGLKGHSDADVLIHAIMDALVGALGLGDIGRHFPDTDPAYKDISSRSMLETVTGLVEREGYALNNLDCTLVAQAPKIAPFLPEMKRNLAESLKTDVNRINIKATTSEGLGFCGKREGMEAFAVVSLIKKDGESYSATQTV
ncbi:2-C-methyl-D-erythritol 2,4-cyclodiphosphate synthase [delta proteobacterium NaphS2]|nr:2-C-methyl-D-erythritol 2,4-cyclodiphosphate synthase [delta proteobacterium NaphS2]